MEMGRADDMEVPRGLMGRMKRGRREVDGEEATGGRIRAETRRSNGPKRKRNPAQGRYSESNGRLPLVILGTSTPPTVY